MVYRKSVNAKLNPIKITKSEQQDKLNDYLKYYSKVIVNPNVEPEKWQIISIKEHLKDIGKPNDDEAIRKFQIENADRVVYRTNNKSFKKLNIKKKIARVTSARGLEYIWWEGKQMLFLSDYIEEYICDLWTDISTINLNKEGGVDFDNGKKPEKLLQRIIEMCTKKNDIVLDYHLGSGTTASTVHKMNRQYIGIEQMDYIETVAVERLKKVINGEQGGISKSVNWQGGGSFVYLELKKYNQIFIDQIEEAKDTNELLQIWEQMKAKSFLNYNVDIKKQEEHIEEFKALELAQQKQHLCEFLNKNQLYVNLDSLDDKVFKCTEDEKRLNRDFYRIKK